MREAQVRTFELNATSAVTAAEGQLQAEPMEMQRRMNRLESAGSSDQAGANIQLLQAQAEMCQ